MKLLNICQCTWDEDISHETLESSQDVRTP